MHDREPNIFQPDFYEETGLDPLDDIVTALGVHQRKIISEVRDRFRGFLYLLEKKDLTSIALSVKPAGGGSLAERHKAYLEETEKDKRERVV